jgi:hypothetical protein
MHRNKSGLAAALALAATCVVAQPASAGAIRIDFGIANSPVGTCTLGVLCTTYLTTNYTLLLPDGTSTQRLFIYREGVIGVGNQLSGDASGVTGGYWIATGLADRGDLEAVTHQNMFTPEADAINWYTGARDTGGVFQFLLTYELLDGADIVYPEPDPDNPDAPLPPVVIGTGAVASLNFTFSNDYPYDPDEPGTDLDPTYGPRPGSGRPPGAIVGSNLPGFDSASSFSFTLIDAPGSLDGGLRAPPAIPEPGTWALLVLGFGSLGAVLRRRRATLA